MTVEEAGPMTPTKFFTGRWNLLHTLDELTAAADDNNEADDTDEEEDASATSNDDRAARVCCSFSSEAAIASRINSMLCSSAIGEYLSDDERFN